MKKMGMRWIFLSPHFDDAVLSCAGLMWELAQAGHPVENWTICAGDPPTGELPPFAAELHARWQMDGHSVAARAEEDRAACQAVGATWQHFTLPDCIYRWLPDETPLIHHRDDLFDTCKPLNPVEVEQVRAWLAENLTAGSRLVVPLTIGGHFDHRTVRDAAEGLPLRLWYYADYPYVVTGKVNLRAFLGAGWRRRRFAISPAGLAAWQAGIACYTSQISSFWRSLDEMRTAMQAYLEQGGNCLWRRL